MTLVFTPGALRPRVFRGGGIESSLGEGFEKGS